MLSRSRVREWGTTHKAWRALSKAQKGEQGETDVFPVGQRMAVRDGPGVDTRMAIEKSKKAVRRKEEGKRKVAGSLR